MATIQFNDVSRIFQRDGKDFLILDKIQLLVQDREFVAIVGPSGCGKTTCMRMAAGLEFPTTGTVKVNGVARNPDYVYDPSKLSYGDVDRKVVVAPGPNNPVGVVWIDLNKPSYGIHGTPDPHKVGKTASHGCVRLTNWDAEQLAAGVKPGVVVRFI